MQKLSNKIKTSLFIVVLLISTEIFAQSFQQDFNKISSANFLNETYSDKNPSFLLPSSKNVIVKYNPVSLLMGSMMYVYQAYFSKQFSTGCLFNPSCSNMSKTFIREFGITKGLFLTADRLTRCNRIAATDVHPIRINSHDYKIHEDANMFRVKSKKVCPHD